jgi:hypothetical protein
MHETFGGQVHVPSEQSPDWLSHANASAKALMSNPRVTKTEVGVADTTETVDREVITCLI